MQSRSCLPALIRNTHWKIYSFPALCKGGTCQRSQAHSCIQLASHMHQGFGFLSALDTPGWGMLYTACIVGEGERCPCSSLFRLPTNYSMACCLLCRLLSARVAARPKQMFWEKILHLLNATVLYIFLNDENSWRFILGYWEISLPPPPPFAHRIMETCSWTKESGSSA